MNGESNFSDRVKDVISYSREEAIRLGHEYIGPEHLLLGLIREGEGLAIKILVNLGLDLSQLKRAIESAVRGTVNTINLTNLPLTRQAEKVLKITRLEAKLLKSPVIGTEHLLLSILREENNVAAQILARFSVTYDIVRSELDQKDDGSPRASVSSEPPESSEMSTPGDRSRKSSKSKTPVLDNFGRDLTKAAEDNKLDPIVGTKKRT